MSMPEGSGSARQSDDELFFISTLFFFYMLPSSFSLRLEVLTYAYRELRTMRDNARIY